MQPERTAAIQARLAEIGLAAFTPRRDGLGLFAPDIGIYCGPITTAAE